jgi:hypothetical protein
MSSRSAAKLATTASERGRAMERVELLKQLSFGSQVAEEETHALARYFVETHQWDRIEKGEIDLVRGDKGAGKSAIYSLLMDRQSEFFDEGILIIGAENPRGDTVFKDIIAEPPASEIEFVALWKLYLLILIAKELREYDIKSSSSAIIFKSLEDAGFLEKDVSRSGILRHVQDYVRRLVHLEALEGGLTFDQNTGMPNGLTGRIVIREPHKELAAQGVVAIDGLFDRVETTLVEHGLKIWVLLDRLDVAFIENHALEANALRALFRVYGDFRKYENISLKIFLREDIWKRIMQPGYREASHLIRYDNLRWTNPSLLNLVMRRILDNQVILDEFGIDRDQVLRDAAEQEAVFDRLFPPQVEQGPQKATTFNWMITRCADSTRQTAPREVIHLLNSILEQEIRRLEQGGKAAADGKLFDRSVFKAALPAVSNARLTQYLYAEYPNQREFVEKLDGAKAEQTPESLAEIWGTNRDAAIIKANELVELGFFEARGTRADPTFWVPFLYRDALHLVQGRAETDEEN